MPQPCPGCHQLKNSGCLKPLSNRALPLQVLMRVSPTVRQMVVNYFRLYTKNLQIAMAFRRNQCYWDGVGEVCKHLAGQQKIQAASLDLQGYILSVILPA